VIFFADLVNKVQSADQDELRGHVLTNGVDANGRLIGFVYRGDPAQPDGTQVFVDDPMVDGSANAQILAAGLAYPAFYATLPAALRTHLATVSRTARATASAQGLWPRSTADPNGPARVQDLPGAELLVMWPKLFRRIVPYLASHSNFDAFDAWLRQDPVNRDDELFLLDRSERGNMHDVIQASGLDIQLTVWPEDFIISPDPAPVGAPAPQAPTPVGTTQPVAAGDVLIVAALPNPVGTDFGQESVTLVNTTAEPVDLAGWSLGDAVGGPQTLSGVLTAGADVRVVLGSAVRLGNQGDTIALADGGQVIDQVAYQQNDVRAGRTICFGR
jgi:hypothetical protein